MAETQLNDDTTVASLESEVKWLSDEVTRLRLNSQSMKKDTIHILDRINVLNEQKDFLGFQLKQIMKRNKVLEAEIGHTSLMLVDAYEHQERGRIVSPDELQEQDELIIERTTDDDGDENRYYGEYSYEKYGTETEGTGTMASGIINDGEGVGMRTMTYDDQNEEYNEEQKPVRQPYPLMGNTKQQPRIGGANMKKANEDALLRPMKSESPTKDKVKAAAYGTGSTVTKLDELFAARCPEEVVLEKEIETVFRQIVARKIEQAASKSGCGQ